MTALYLPKVLRHNDQESTHLKDSPMIDYGRELLIESKNGNYEKVRALIELGAPYTADWVGITPLYYATYYNHIEIVEEFLVRTGTALDIKNKVDRTALHVACQMGHFEIVKLLLAFNADVNAKDMLKMSPLHWAVESGNPEIVKLVLNHGSWIYCVDKFGKSASDIAEDKEDYVIARLIQDARDMPAGQRIAIINATKKLSQTYAKTVITRNICKRESFQMLSKKAKIAIFLDRETSLSKLTSKLQTSEVQNKPITIDCDSNPIIIKDEPESPPSNGYNHKTVKFLEAHGIKMVKPDTGTVVSSAVASGQSVRLTEAGKLALISSKPEKNAVKTVVMPKPKSIIQIPKGKPGHIIKPSTNPKGLPINFLGNGKKIIKVKADELIKMATQKKFVIKTSPSPSALKPVLKLVPDLKLAPKSASNKSPQPRFLDGKLFTNIDHYIEKLKIKQSDCEKNIIELEKLLVEKRTEIKKICALIETAIKDKAEAT